MGLMGSHATIVASHHATIVASHHATIVASHQLEFHFPQQQKTTHIPFLDQYYKQNATYGQNTVLLYHWQRARRTKLKTMLFHYFHKPHLWNSQNIGWVTYRQLLVNSSNSSKHLLVEQMLHTITFPPQDHQYVSLLDASQYIIVMRCLNNYRVCWIRELSSKAIAHG